MRALQIAQFDNHLVETRRIASLASVHLENLDPEIHTELRLVSRHMQMTRMMGTLHEARKELDIAVHYMAENAANVQAIAGLAMTPIGAQRIRQRHEQVVETLDGLKVAFRGAKLALGNDLSLTEAQMDAELMSQFERSVLKSIDKLGITNRDYIILDMIIADLFRQGIFPADLASHDEKAVGITKRVVEALIGMGFVEQTGSFAGVSLDKSARESALYGITLTGIEALTPTGWAGIV